MPDEYLDGLHNEIKEKQEAKEKEELQRLQLELNAWKENSISKILLRCFAKKTEELTTALLRTALRFDLTDSQKLASYHLISARLELITSIVTLDSKGLLDMISYNSFDAQKEVE